MRQPIPLSALVVACLTCLPIEAAAQGTLADYQRAMALRDRYQNLATGLTDQTRWVQDTQKLVYRRTVPGGHEFLLVDADTQAKAPAFDHARLADALSTALGRKVTGTELPFTDFTFTPDLRRIEFQLAPRPGAAPAPAGPPAPPWRCSLDSYTCAQESRAAGRGGRGGRGGGGLSGPVRAELDVNDAEPQRSPDGKFEAMIRNYNVAIRENGGREVTLLSTDGSEGGYYNPASLVWSPDSTKLAVYKVTPGHRRYVHYVESSPEDQLQPKHSTLQYAKPGDVLDVERPFIFHVASRKQIAVDTALFANAYDMTRLEWRRDSSAVTFEYNQRGHQLYRVISIDPASGAARALITEESKTFFCYSGKKFRQDLAGGREIIWMSERDGWNHLYLYDGATGAVKQQITKGEWVVRNVVKVNEDARTIYFAASGMDAGKDPYFVRYYRINIDGTGLLPLTPADGHHTVAFSATRSTTSTRIRASTPRRSPSCAAPTMPRWSQHWKRPTSPHWRKPAGSRPKSSWRRAATAARTSGASSSSRPRSIRRRSTRSSKTFTPARRAPSCPSPSLSVRSTPCRRRRSSASSSCRSTAWGPATARRPSTTWPGRT